MLTASVFSISDTQVIEGNSDTEMVFVVTRYNAGGDYSQEESVPYFTDPVPNSPFAATTGRFDGTDDYYSQGFVATFAPGDALFPQYPNILPGPALPPGVAEGSGFGLNARAALITRGLAEITRLGVALGGQPGTFMGLTGMGDLILTCTGDLSRNRRVGLGLAEGKALDTIVAELGHVAEGVPCAKAVRELARKLGVDMPITNAVAGVLFDGDKPTATIAALLARDPRDEVA